jgi:hypothetical protein
MQFSKNQLTNPSEDITNTSISDPKLSAPIPTHTLQTLYFPVSQRWCDTVTCCKPPIPIANNTWRVYARVTPINFSPWANRIRGIACDYQQSTGQRCKYYKYISTDFIYSYKAEVVGRRSKTTEYWLVDIAVLSCHVVQFQGLANAVGCSIANHTNVQIIRQSNY